MDPNTLAVNHATQIAVTVPVEAITAGNLLLGRYNAESGALTDIKVIDSPEKVPTNTELTRYGLLNDGAPLDIFVGEKCDGWDGASPIQLIFNRADGSYVGFNNQPQAAAATGQ